jgi:catechol 2,3-dioxygenase-like lactoylglutathione lyase family enzyme
MRPGGESGSDRLGMAGTLPLRPAAPTGIGTVCRPQAGGVAPFRLPGGKAGRRKVRRDQPETHDQTLPRSFQMAAGAVYSFEASNAKDTAMTEFAYDHVHLRSPDPEETARYYQRMFGAEIIKSVQSDGRERVDMKLGGVMMFIAKVEPDQILAQKPGNAYVGLDHLGLRVRGIDAVCAELKKKGAEFTVEPKTIRPGVRIAFVRGPQDVLIEILDRDVA